jgi:hypothetical protein
MALSSLIAEANYGVAGCKYDFCLTVGVGLVPTLRSIEGNQKGLPLRISYLDSATPQLLHRDRFLFRVRPFLIC